ncbi:MAG: pentapeptide repeat-containing protein, partial [Mastigocoleus sp. MO_167.B18]|nr:pentapeptide repeat-containing protein [Mastigocoleus sp. MO_167.B18]
MFFVNSINIIFICIFLGIFYAFFQNRKKIEKIIYKSKEIRHKAITGKNEGATQGNLHINLEKLQSTNINTRISGINALESVVQDSPQLYWQTMEAIANYVKQNSPIPKIKDNKENLRITKDIQVALNFLGKKSSNENENNRINLINCDSCSRNFVNTDFSTTKLTAGSFWRANLSHTNLVGAQLEGTNFSNTDFRGADLSNV